LAGTLTISATPPFHVPPRTSDTWQTPHRALFRKLRWPILRDRTVLLHFRRSLLPDQPLPEHPSMPLLTRSSRPPKPTLLAILEYSGPPLPCVISPPTALAWIPLSTLLSFGREYPRPLPHSSDRYPLCPKAASVPPTSSSPTRSRPPLLNFFFPPPVQPSKTP